MASIVDHVPIMLSANRALLGAVFPQLRAVLVSAWGNKWRVRFYVDGEITRDEHETLSIAATEIVSDMPHDLKWEETIERLDYPTAIPSSPEFTWVYERKE
jgi:hypothetical protein